MNERKASLGLSLIKPLEATILVVDDTPHNLTFICGLLKDNYRVKVTSGAILSMLPVAWNPQDYPEKFR